MIYGSVCSGIEAASAAWGPLGWKPAWFAEIDPFPSAVLAERFPGVQNLGDFTTIGADAGPIDVLVGGTPCQSFSVAGLRKGLADDRGNLAIAFLRLAGRLRPRWVVWENVFGVLSSGGGRDLGSFLGGLVELGYGFAYRVLDAQYVRVDGFGRAVPQRRRRVFVVGCLGDWRYPAAVLFDRESLHGHSPPLRKPGEVAAAFTPSGIGGYREGCGTLRAEGGDIGGGSKTLVACTLPASNGGASSGMHPVVPVAFGGNNTSGPIDVATAVNAHGGPDLPCGTLHQQPHVVAFQERGREGGRSLEWQEDVSYALRAISGGGCSDWFNVAYRWAVRRGWAEREPAS